MGLNPERVIGGVRKSKSIEFTPLPQHKQFFSKLGKHSSFYTNRYFNTDIGFSK